ncbi:hypothetical protein GIB67_041193 [Kingdonia uniflora]|uniref:Protein kinase domain-containing protein n=1 Tax=Kingdonia uniflora TaxID=39325 RepID=A0A7J7MIT7_9MAGN|nr:hypothetical protein GIB67_041193 [Kingdonia uniflora]
MRKLGRLPNVSLTYEDLITATNNFGDRLGRGGSGSVFKGSLKEGSTTLAVAVKRIDWTTEYGKQYFEAEISTIASVRHVHLIRLRGYCRHMIESGGGFYVVYDLLPNGSLDTWIFPGMGGPTGQFLSWKLRYEVAVGVARALVYLHHDCSPPILHLDVKPPNILLDVQFRAVLSDFGLSKLTSEDGSEVRSKHIRGTPGYIAPELYQGKPSSAKCDMYSYGQVNAKNLMGLIDKRLREDGKVDEKEANSLVYVALCCLDEEPNNRPPDMRNVLHMLETYSTGKPDGIGAMVDRLAEGTVSSANGGLFVIKLHEAQNIEFQDNTKNLIARVKFKGESDETSPVKKSINPKWKEEFSFSLEEALRRDDELVVDVLSQMYTPTIGFQDSYRILGLVKINLSDVVEKKKTNEMYSLTEFGEEKIHIELEWRPKWRPLEDFYMLETGKLDGIGAMVDRLAEGTVPSPNGGLLVIKLHEAQNIEFQDNTKNLIARVKFKGESDETSPVKKSINPKWKEEFSFSLEEALHRDDELVVDVLSQMYTPTIGFQDSYRILGLVKINLSDVIEKKKTNEMYSLTEFGEEKIHIELEWRPEWRPL